MSLFLKRAGSYASMLLSEHLFKLYWDESPDNIAIQNPAAVVAGLRELRIGRLCRISHLKMGKLPLQITFPSICKKSKLNYIGILLVLELYVNEA